MRTPAIDDGEHCGPRNLFQKLLQSRQFQQCTEFDPCELPQSLDLELKLIRLFVCFFIFYYYECVEMQLLGNSARRTFLMNLILTRYRILYICLKSELNMLYD